MINRLNDTRPLARQKALVVEHLGDEVLVYDLEADRAHCLNATAALIWKNCDGHTSVGQLAQLLEQESHVPASEEIARLALHQLSKKRLLAGVPAVPGPALVSRRALIRGLGVAAAALPLITSIVSPTPAQAATCLSSGQACETSAQCCSGLCDPGTQTCA
ncbi:MAG: PqqD family peptide modification chaperone [Pyrinomonadaceae bacterium]